MSDVLQGAVPLPPDPEVWAERRARLAPPRRAWTPFRLTPEPEPAPVPEKPKPKPAPKAPAPAPAPKTPAPAAVRAGWPRRDSEALTRLQQRVLDAVRSMVQSRGYPPTLRELGDELGLTSVSSVAYHLKALERKGYLRRDPKRPRALEVLDPTAKEGEPPTPEPAVIPPPPPPPPVAAPCEVCGLTVTADYIARTGRARHGHHPEEP